MPLALGVALVIVRAAGSDAVLDTIMPDLWSFSLSVYAAPGVPEACLMAQDGHGADVNLLLWAAWLAAQGHRLTGDELAAARAATEPWRDEIVRPLRSLRRRLKAGPAPAPTTGTEPLRDQIKAAELEAERVQQGVLTTLPPIRRSDCPLETALPANLALLLPGDAVAVVTVALHSAIRGH